jgi:hypothetical protein
MPFWRALQEPGADGCCDLEAAVFDMDGMFEGRLAQVQLRLSVHGLELADVPVDDAEQLLLLKELGYTSAIARAQVKQVLRLHGASSEAEPLVGQLLFVEGVEKLPYVEVVVEPPYVEVVAKPSVVEVFVEPPFVEVVMKPTFSEVAEELPLVEVVVQEPAVAHLPLEVVAKPPYVEVVLQPPYVVVEEVAKPPRREVVEEPPYDEVVEKPPVVEQPPFGEAVEKLP